jgi:hypothetical protein
MDALVRADGRMEHAIRASRAVRRSPEPDWDEYDALCLLEQLAFEDTRLLSPGYTELTGTPFPSGFLSDGTALPATECPWPASWKVAPGTV